MSLTVDNLEDWDKRVDSGLEIYKLRVWISSSDVSTWDSECGKAGNVYVEKTAFGNKVAYDTTSDNSNTVTFSFSTTITGLPNPLTLILKRYSRKQISHGTSPLYRIDIEGYKTS